ncbi:MATE family efflux transporter [Candidatus Soleaferrea massiliensis]|uniref:MATE family efflux transporter n=1 Tax=Candidatus Soleaferrea massiliensis TaxID=1470354 RepID=UPI0009E31602|nr:MATE family efflux transporter [Candidatus Soleaferrea massiliensis]
MKEQENIMGTKRVFPLLMSMAIPPMISMLIQSMYNIVDSIFVAQMGEDALTAVSLAFPLQNLVLAVAVGLGVGLNSCIARSLGARKFDEVNRTATHGIVFTALHALLFVILGLVLIQPFIRMFTQDETVFSYACQYSYIVICFSFGSLFHINIEKMFQATGNMVMPMILQAVGAVINIILDPILIFGKFGFPQMGVAGAAVATIIGQITACVLAVILFARNSGGIHISLKGFKTDAGIAKRVYSVAVPSALMIAMPSILVSILNGILSAVSQTAVAVFGLYYKIQTFVYMPASGLVQGMRPIVSYNYGAGLQKRLYATLKSSLLVIGVIMLIGTGLFMLMPESILSLFNATQDMMDIGVPALRIISAGFLFSTVGVILSGAFEALGRGLQSLTITMIRQLILIPPLAILLMRPLGLAGVWMTFPLSELAAAIVAVFLFLYTKKRLYLSDCPTQSAADKSFAASEDILSDPDASSETIWD